jgi:hypothetical protein
MSQVKSLIAGLLQNPSLLKGLIDNPEGFARLAGVGQSEMRSLKHLGNVASGLVNQVSGQGLTPSAKLPNRSAPAGPRAKGSRTEGGQGVALVAVVSLAAAVGAVVTVATVSVVALAEDN